MTHGTAADFARRHVEEIINGRRLDLVDELYAPDAVYNDPVAPGGTARGRHEIKAFYSAIFQAMPNVRFTIEDNFGTADRGPRPVPWHHQRNPARRLRPPPRHRKVRHRSHCRDCSDRRRADRRGLGLPRYAEHYAAIRAYPYPWRRVAPIAKTRFSPALRGRGSEGR
jgi:hypothetical protein